MQQRKRIDHAIERARAEVDTHIAGRGSVQNVLDLGSVQAAWELAIRQFFEAHQPLFKSNGAPDVLPERHAAGPVAQVFEPTFQQTVHAVAPLFYGNI